MKKICSLMLISSTLLFTACKKDFESLEKDPNRPTSVPANLILNGVLTDMTDKPFSPTQRWNQF